jgi:hypothetical protein
MQRVSRRFAESDRTGGAVLSLLCGVTTRAGCAAVHSGMGSMAAHESSAVTVGTVVNPHENRSVGESPVSFLISQPVGCAHTVGRRWGRGRQHQHVQGDNSAMPEHRTRICGIKTSFKTGETEDETVITVETSPAVMPPAWVNFLKQRLQVLHIDYEHIGAGRIVVLSTPHAAESVARLVISAVEVADQYLKTVLGNMRAHRVQYQIAADAVERRAELVSGRPNFIEH